ncbi:MAG: class I SAM-dependent methyltransferase [Okeania sp. SIO3I5]|uniref:class I SAM-dependent methyltransferase n=1 Tax=Okeania sp. SIO3I5 TaxID=2607805 RepID=UPI0013BC9FA7|nr:class I SAM-dependent methyltransferase [Okeania sp. SIO3I5]NEQ38237.1 class I SAM-dependent methyltransferase [Okeania sp. SIO3I5]
MAVKKDTIYEKFLSPLVNTFLIDQEAMKQFHDSIDWEAQSDRLTNPNLVYPKYYTSGNFHGIEGGYLTIGAAVTYDPITQYALPPNETWVRKALVDAVQVRPRRILDLGCGTGSMTIMLKQAFPQAKVIGIDLSPYMLGCAEVKAKTAGLNIQWQHDNAEKTGFPDGYFDLVTIALLFHETPPQVSRSILQEIFRLLKVGGQVVILDGNQKTLRQTEWLTEIFEEPYIKSYARGNIDAWLGAAGFGTVETQDIWWLHQVSSGVKPLLAEYSEIIPEVNHNLPNWDNDSDRFPTPAY